MLDLSRLSPAQREAALAPDGPLLILAGPGSGKTTVLAARIAHLLLDRGVSPSSLLALTFTTAAARTLRWRVGGLVGNAVAALADIGTFHSFGLRIVRQWGAELGLGTGPISVYGAGETRALLAEAAAELGVDGLPLTELAGAVERHRLQGEEDAGHADLVRRLAETYEALLQVRAAVDYAGMLALPLRLLQERPTVRRLYQDACRYVLADEVQDVCVAQYALLRLLAERHRNLAVVGDPAQTLYGWRGADVRIVLGFTRDFPEARVVTLDQNFRSTGRIVDLANALGAPLGYRGPVWTDNPPGQSPLVFVAPDENAEAAWVAEEIERLLDAEAIEHPGEVGVLYRANRQAEALALALRTRGLPYRVRGGGDLFARREVRDALAYLRLVHNPADSAALTRIVNTPPRRLGRLAEALERQPIPLAALEEAARRQGAPAAAAAHALTTLIADLRAEQADRTIAELLDEALARSGYLTWLRSLEGGGARLAHLRTLRDLAARTEGDLGDWLAELQLGEEADAAPDDHRAVLTTIHQAKGLEWRVVFLVGVEEGLLPHGRALRVSDGAGPDHAEGEAAERRVAYVAVTRPRERLYVTYCRQRTWGERTQAREPSRFLRALPSSVLAPAA